MSIELLKTYQEDNKLSQASLAKILGVSSAVISQYLKGEYKGDVVTLGKKVKELLEREAQNVVLIRVNPTFSVKVLLNELCQKLGLTASKSNNDNFNALVGKLSGSSRLIIVDEAEQLNYKCLEIIRNLHDLTGVGVILAGMPKLKINLQGKSLEFRQLYSRVDWVCDLENALSDEDIGKLASAFLGTEEFNGVLIKHAKGNARRLSKLIKGAEQIAQMNKKCIDGVVIEQAAKMLIG